jgi:predicted HicB family RNase H-like nuclease
MTNQLHYKNYIGNVFFSEEDGVFHGKIVGISDSISFEGDSVKSLTEDFQNSVDEYLEFCADSDKQPEKSTFSVKISPEIYNKATIYATQKGLPLNMFVERIIETNISTL